MEPFPSPCSYSPKCLERLSGKSRTPRPKALRTTELGHRGGLFLQCCATKTHSPEATVRLFGQSQKVNSRKLVCRILHKPGLLDREKARPDLVEHTSQH
jgi:hypothetical protein